MPAFDRNLSILLRTFCMMIVRLNILEGRKFRVKMSILNGAEKMPKPKCIRNFRVIYDDNGQCCGSHTVTYVSGNSGLIMFFGQYSDMGVTSWTSLVSKDWG